MSTQAKNFTQLPNGFLFESKLSPQGKKKKLNSTQKFMMICLEAYMRREGNKEVQISLKQFAGWMNSDVKTVSNNQKKLEAMGLIATRSPYKEDGSQETTYWMLMEQFEFELKEVEEQENVSEPIGEIPVPPTGKNPIPYGKNSDTLQEKTESKDNTLLNTSLNTKLNTSFSIDIESELNDLAFRVFGERMTPTIKSNIISIYKKHCKDNKFNLEMYESILEEVSQQTNITSFYKYLLASVENELAGKPSPAKKDFTSNKPKKVVRKELVPKWLGKETSEEERKQKEEYHNSAEWLAKKADMEAKLKALDKELKAGNKENTHV